MTRAGRPSQHAQAAAAPTATTSAGMAAGYGSRSRSPTGSQGPATDHRDATRSALEPPGGRVGLVATLLIVVVRGYQRWVSPMLPPSCRFYPSCSAYAVTALARHGAVRGSALAVWRLLRCHPFNPGGVDPVPERTTESTSGEPAPAKTR
jgi:uncharacterized protein